MHPTPTLVSRTPATFLLALACGCFPAITHGPKIENGFIVGVTGGSVSGNTHAEADEGGIYLRQPVLGAFIGYGHAPTRRELPGFYLGAAVPLFFPAAQVDAFLQAPPGLTGPLSAGVGAIASGDGTAGYTMLGGQLNRTTAWHVGAGYGSRRSSSSFQSSSPAWMGSAAIETATGYLRTQIFLQIANGRTPGYCFDDPAGHSSRCTLGERAHAMTLGISLGRHERNVSRGAADAKPRTP
jgi:hypothetical protein